MGAHQRAGVRPMNEQTVNPWVHFAHVSTFHDIGGKTACVTVTPCDTRPTENIVNLTSDPELATCPRCKGKERRLASNFNILVWLDGELL